VIFVTATIPYIMYYTKGNFSKIEDIMYKNKVKAGTYLFWDGERAEKLYYVKQGKVKITKSTDDGREFILYLFQEGDLFGEIGSFGESSYSFNAEVSSDSQIGVILQRDLEILLGQNGDLAVEFMKWIRNNAPNYAIQVPGFNVIWKTRRIMFYINSFK
jgi:CRP/FNR family cyclic AMP-dependent transcriptional regulator